jgi:hypothetical protein
MRGGFHFRLDGWLRATNAERISSAASPVARETTASPRAANGSSPSARQTARNEHIASTGIAGSAAQMPARASASAAASASSHVCGMSTPARSRRSMRAAETWAAASVASAHRRASQT